jgi:hypothetical protein
MPFSLNSVMGPNAEHMAAIGEVAMECAHLENNVQLLLMDMADLDFRKGRCITAHMPIRTACDSVEALGGELGFDEEKRKELKGLMVTAVRLVASRNSIVHALWGITPESTVGKREATAVVIKARSKLSIAHENMTPESISEIAQSIRAHTLQVANFRVAFGKSKSAGDGL